MTTDKARDQCQVTMLSPHRCHPGRRGSWGHPRSIYAGKTCGGRGAYWGLDRLVGADKAKGGRKLLTLCPGLPAPPPWETTG